MTCQGAAAGEDPFATHLLIQSADKLLTDLAAHSPPGKLVYDWTEVMKPEYKDALLRVHRETFNFLKHADRDHDQTLHVGDITLSNILQLGVGIYNFYSLSNTFTDRMRLGAAFARLAFPDGFVNDDQRAFHDESVSRLGRFTLRELLAALPTEAVRRNFPNLATEREEDLQDVNYAIDRQISRIRE
jgi:hypothetical protein